MHPRRQLSTVLLSSVALLSVSFNVVPWNTIGKSRTLLLEAKKGKTKKKNKKKGGFAWASTFTLQPFEAKVTRELAEIAVASYRGRAGQSLCSEVEGAADVPKALWKAPVACVIVSEDTTNDPTARTKVNYANMAAMETIGLPPADFEKLFLTGPNTKEGTEVIQLNLPPVMNGAKTLERGYRKKMYESADDTSITILEATRWSLEKSMLIDGKFVTTSIGVAYAWSEWIKGDNILCQPGGIETAMEDNVDLGDIDARIQKQGDVVRDLKENQGFGNKDPPVVEAVQELLRLKALRGE